VYGPKSTHDLKLLAWLKSHNGPVGPRRGARRERAPGAVTVTRAASAARWPATDPGTRCGEGGGQSSDKARDTRRARGGRRGLTDSARRRWGGEERWLVNVPRWWQNPVTGGSGSGALQ
jgi:hypothetical protein